MTAGPGLDALTDIDVHGHAEVSTGQPPVPHEEAAEAAGLTIILAHPPFPWQDEALAVATC